MSGRGTVHQARGLRARGGRFAMPGRGEGAASGPKGPSGVIGVVSGKGGVGKSALAANVSVAAAATGGQAQEQCCPGRFRLGNEDPLRGRGEDLLFEHDPGAAPVALAGSVGVEMVDLHGLTSRLGMVRRDRGPGRAGHRRRPGRAGPVAGEYAPRATASKALWSGPSA